MFTSNNYTFLEYPSS